MKIYWTMVISLGLVVMFGSGILVLGTKLGKLADEQAQSAATSVGRVTSKHEAAFSLIVSRRTMQSVLGLIWFLDGIFQLKPQMFSQAFIQQVILPTGQSQPSWMSSLVHWGANLVVGHIIIWNTLFALVQVALGLAMISNFKIRQTIIASLLWSAIVWIFGEGSGQLLSGQALLLNGAPGAVVIYGLIGISIYPKGDGDRREWRHHGIRFAQISLAVLLAVGFVLHLQPVYLTSNGFSQAIAVPWVANAFGNHGVINSVVLGDIELALAVMLFLKIRLRIAVWVSIVLFALYWWVGQSFGQIFAPFATDFNSGLLMILLAICCNPKLVNGHVQKQQQVA